MKLIMCTCGIPHCYKHIKLTDDCMTVTDGYAEIKFQLNRGNIVEIMNRLEEILIENPKKT